MNKEESRLTILEEKFKICRNGRKKKFYVCKCKCGNVKEIEAYSVNSGHTKSCGCLSLEITKNIGYKNIRLYDIWNNMKLRCYNKNNNHYKYYGGKGIKICAEWLIYENFYIWAMKNGYKDNLTIERIDYNGNYEPTNCKWASIIEQANNKSNNKLITYNGKTQTIAKWARELNMNYEKLRQRITKYKWGIGRALNEGNN